MNPCISETFDWVENRIKSLHITEKVGKVMNIGGLIIESQGPEVSIGDVVAIYSKRDVSFSAEVVGFRENRVLLMPLEEVKDIHSGCRVVAKGRGQVFPVGEGLIGRVINGLGDVIDEKGPMRTDHVKEISGMRLNPINRTPISNPLQTKVKAIDNFVALGEGQRLGIFAGSGVGKSSLLGMLARSSTAEVNVIALIGERGRELNEFIQNDLGQEGMKKSVIIISTSDEPAPIRIRAAHLATKIAEDFRSKGKKVLLLMDSITRFAMAQREIGLAIGEPPTTRGYTPSVFSQLPKLIERTGKIGNGSITAIYTVLVEGDDMNEPIADATRGLLDGHIVLSRELATLNHYPAIDILESISRLEKQIMTKEHISLISQARDLLGVYRKNEDLINVGAYTKGTNSKIDKAIMLYPNLVDFLKQGLEEPVDYHEGFETLKAIIQ